MFKMFKKKTHDLVAVVDGKLVDITSVNDDTFANKLMGEGLAIIPCANQVYAPIDAEIKVVAASKHAIGLEVNGHEILIHIGIDTVELNGVGFTSHVNVGQKVKAGDLLVSFDEDYLSDEELDLTTMVILIGKPTVSLKFSQFNQDVKAKQDIIVSIV